MRRNAANKENKATSLFLIKFLFKNQVYRV